MTHYGRDIVDIGDSIAAAKRFTCHWCKGSGREIQSNTVSTSPVISVHLHTYCRACRGVGFMSPARLAKLAEQGKTP